MIIYVNFRYEKGGGGGGLQLISFSQSSRSQRGGAMKSCEAHLILAAPGGYSAQECRVAIIECNYHGWI